MGDLNHYVGVFSDITYKKAAEDEIKHLAFYDILTRLPNRRLMLDRLAQALTSSARHKRHCALMMIDLDNFKTVNETRGHDRGDALLLQVAHRLRSCVHEDDTVARQGGDEFTVLLPGLSERAPIERIAEGIIDALCQPFQLGTDIAYVSASIGITLCPQDAETPADILRNADQAMYAAKAEGRNRFSYFSPAMQQRALQHLQLGKDLRKALARGELSLHYQPILHLASGRVCKAEALLRWAHPERGNIPPGEFIPVAEELSLIDAIGSWVFEQATAAIQRWRALWPADATGPSPLQVTINASPRQFAKGPSLDVLLQRVDALGLPGRCIAPQSGTAHRDACLEALALHAA